MSKKLDEIIKKALDNIEEDRLVTRDLLEDAMQYLAKDEQMVKVATLIQKEEKKDDGISKEEMDNLFSVIAEEKDGN